MAKGNAQPLYGHQYNDQTLAGEDAEQRTLGHIPLPPPQVNKGARHGAEQTGKRDGKQSEEQKIFHGKEDKMVKCVCLALERKEADSSEVGLSFRLPILR
jgi:hypothetical protein